MKLFCFSSPPYSRRASGGAVGLGRGLIHDGVKGNFHWHNSSGRTMVLGSTQPLILINTRNVSWGVKAAGA